MSVADPDPDIEAPPDPRKVLVEAEDEIIAYFCELHGGLEFAMPIVQTQIKRIGIEFNNPTKDQLIQLVKSLTDITSKLQSKDAARKEHNQFMRILRNV